MAIVLTLNPRELGKFERKLKAKFDTIIRESLEATARQAQLEARALARRQGILDRGGFQRGLRVVAKGRDSITLYNTAPHARFVEGGRRAGARMPPKAPILAWVLRRGMPASAWWPVARKIAERGIKPRRVLTQPTFQRRMRKLMRDNALRSLNKAIRGMR